jgi:hypothetical protein
MENARLRRLHDTLKKEAGKSEPGKQKSHPKVAFS